MTSAAARRGSSPSFSPSTSPGTESSPRTWAWPRIERGAANDETAGSTRSACDARAVAGALPGDHRDVRGRPESAGRRHRGINALLDDARHRPCRAQRRLAYRLLLDERAGGPAALENVRGRGRREGELRPLVGFDHPVADRDREPRAPAQLGPRGHHHGEPPAPRRAAAIRPAAGAWPAPAGARPNPPLVRRPP